MKTCANCGMINYDDSSFCCGCGSPLGAVQPAESPAPQPPEQPSVPPQSSAPGPMPAQSPQNPAPGTMGQSSVPAQVSYQPNPGGPTYPAGQAAPVYPPYTAGPAVNPPSPPYSPYTYGAVQQPPAYGGNPSRGPADVLQSVKEIFSSPLMLALVIVWFVNCIFTVVVGLTSKTVSNALETTNTPFTYELNRFITEATKISSLTSAIPGILIGVGLLMAYLSAKNTMNSPLAMSSSGMTVVQVVTIIKIVASCLGIAFCIVFSVMLLAGTDGVMNILGRYFGNTDNIKEVMSIVGVAVLVCTIIAGALIVTFYVLYLKFIGSVIETIRTGVFQAKFATFVFVIAFISGGMSALGALSSLAALVASPTAGLLSFTASAAAAAASILLGVLVSNYKKLGTVYY